MHWLVMKQIKSIGMKYWKISLIVILITIILVQRELLSSYGSKLDQCVLNYKDLYQTTETLAKGLRASNLVNKKLHIEYKEKLSKSLDLQNTINETQVANNNTTEEILNGPTPRNGTDSINLLKESVQEFNRGGR